MAGAPDNPSRRAVLGAAVALPLIASAAPGPLHHAAHGPPPRPGEEWERAVAAYRAAEAALEEAGRVCARATRAEVFAAEEVYGDRLEELYGRLRELLTAPAPDLRAFCAKEIGRAHV